MQRGKSQDIQDIFSKDGSYVFTCVTYTLKKNCLVTIFYLEIASKFHKELQIIGNTLN